MIDRDAAIETIRHSQMAAYAESLIKMLAPSIRIGLKPTRPDDLPLGASRFGGTPDVPPDFDWPHCVDRPMSLVAQLQLSDVAPLDPAGRLPAEGWLYFFFDTSNEEPFADQTAAARPWRVIHHIGRLEALERAAQSASRAPFRTCSAGFDAELTLPSFGSAPLVNIDMDENLREAYEDLVFSLHARPPMPGWRDSSTLRRWIGQFQHWWLGDPIHRMLGHPEHFQVDPRADWERLAHHETVSRAPTNKLMRESRDWLLLLQVDTYRDGPDWMWGENGTLYFGIQAEDLAARNFDAVQWTIECG